MNEYILVGLLSASAVCHIYCCAKIRLLTQGCIFLNRHYGKVTSYLADELNTLHDRIDKLEDK